jgi:hypothetical protein
LCAFVDKEISGRGYDHPFTASVKLYDQDPEVTPKGCLGISIETDDCFYRTHVFANADDPAALSVPARLLRNDVTSLAAYEQIAEWLTTWRSVVSSRLTS